MLLDQEWDYRSWSMRKHQKLDVQLGLNRSDQEAKNDNRKKLDTSMQGAASRRGVYIQTGWKRTNQLTKQ